MAMSVNLIAEQTAANGGAKLPPSPASVSSSATFSLASKLAAASAAGSVGLRRLANEHGRQPRRLGDSNGKRHAAKLKTSKHLHAGRQQADQLLGDLAQ